jgi:hypothetical protein
MSVLSVRRRFFISDIARRIKQDVIDFNQELNFAQTVSIGDIDLMPSPQTLSNREIAKTFLPAVFIMPDDVFNTTVSPNKTIASGRYDFILRYVHYYDNEDTTDTFENALMEAEILADSLLEDHNIDIRQPERPEYVEVVDKNNYVQGMILGSDVHRISINSIDTEVFRQFNIPVLVADIEYEVTFRSVHKPYIKGV